MVQFRFGADVVTVNMADWASLSASVRQRFAARRGFSLATINLDHLVKLRGDAAFRKAYAAQDFVVADGNPIRWLARVAGRPVSLLPGSDLVAPLCKLAADQGIGVALIGSTDAALEEARTALESKVRGLDVRFCHAPSFGFDPSGEEAEAILEQLADSGARLCLLALGAPRQEQFAAEGREKAPAVGFVSVGAGLDFLGGRQRRAPAWVRAVALEWLWRAMQSPARLGPRYAKCAAILPAQLWQAVRLRFG